MLWNQQEPNPLQVVTRASVLSREWTFFNKQRVSHVVPQETTYCHAWKKPPHGYVKINVDAGFNSTRPKAGFGWCVRDSGGNFLLARVSNVAGHLTAAEGEALGLLHAVKWATSLPYNRVIFESDCKVVQVDRINKFRFDPSELGIILNNCKAILANYPNFHVVFASRKANTVAHVLAHRGTLVDMSQTFHHTPFCIAETIMNEIL